LEQLSKLYVNRETLRQWLIKEGLWEISKKGHKHRRSGESGGRVLGNWCKPMARITTGWKDEDHGLC